jgi:hypothetical protein
MPAQGRFLTILALYWRHTHDSGPILEHLDKVEGVFTMLLERRRASQAAHPNASSPMHGMPTGNDEADLWWCTTAGGATERAFISIAAEAWRGMRDCGEALREISDSMPHSRYRETAAARNLSSRMLREAPGQLRDLHSSLARSSFPEPPEAGRPNVTCHPYAAGEATCGMLQDAPSSRDSEAWRTYAEALYSGAIPANVTAEILEWHQTARAPSGSRLKLGVLTGSGLDVASGDALETFTLFGWGYGLLQADLVEPFVLQWLAVVAHGYTRGTWIAPESSYVDRTVQSPSFATPAGLLAPLYLKWACVFEDPVSHTLWIAKATPRVWMAEGETIALENVPTAYGRIGMRIGSEIRTRARVHANLTLPLEWASPRGRGAHARPAPPGQASSAPPWRPPPGGICLRLRPPGDKRVIGGVTIGGSAWTTFDPVASTINLDAKALSSPGMLQRLTDVWVSFVSEVA